MISTFQFVKIDINLRNFTSIHLVKFLDNGRQRPSQPAEDDRHTEAVLFLAENKNLRRSNGSHRGRGACRKNCKAITIMCDHRLHQLPQ